MDEKTDRHVEKWIDRQKYGQTARKMDRQIEIQIDRQKDRKLNRQIDRLQLAAWQLTSQECKNSEKSAKVENSLVVLFVNHQNKNNTNEKSQ